MPVAFEDVAAVLVAYAPQSEPAAIARKLLDVVGRVVVVDNSTGGHPGVAGCDALPHVDVINNQNRGGLAGAYNAARSFLGAQGCQPQLVVLLDDDSDTDALRGFLSDPLVAQTLSSADTACVAPAHRDRATGLRARHMQLRRFGWTYLSREVRGLQPVAFVINSMSVWRMDALQRVGAHNEWLGVDHVDTEYCLRAHRCGLAVYLHGGFEFAQSIGQRHAYRLLGRTLQSGGHSIGRRYIVSRSLCRLARTWLVREPAFAALCVCRLVYEALGIMAVERERPQKLAALARGALAGLLARS